MSESSPIILISGPPGAGKSTVARELVGSSKTPVAYLEGDTFWSFIARSKPAADEVETRKQNARIIVRAMLAAAVRYAHGGYDTFLDFTIGPWHLHAMKTAIKQTPLDYVVICPSEAVCADRAAARAEGAIPGYSYYRGLYAAFDEIAGFERHFIRNDQADALEIAAQIRAGLEAGAYRIELPT